MRDLRSVGCQHVQRAEFARNYGRCGKRGADVRPCWIHNCAAKPKKPSNFLASVFSYRAVSGGHTMTREMMWVMGSMVGLFTLGTAILYVLGS